MDYPEILKRFTSLTFEARRVQQETLLSILRSAKESPYGQKYGFDRIRSIEEYRAALPIVTYEELRPWLADDAAALTGERPLYFLNTSGSTGKSKLIPCTASYRESLRRASDVYTAQVFTDFPSVADGPHGLGLYQRTPSSESHLGIPFATLVSQLFAVSRPEDTFFRSLPEEMYRITDAKERLLAMAKHTKDWDLRGIRATNPTTLLLFARVLSEAFGKKPSELWPNLELVIGWRGGACDQYRPFIEESYGKARFRALMVGASEGVIAIPLDDTMRGGAPAIESTFFEFRPEGKEHTVLVDELTAGTRYELIMTTFSGLYRYAIGDLFDVEGVYGGCPTITFVGRAGRTSSMTGEKLTEVQVEEAVGGVSRRLGIAPRYYVVSARFGEVPSYVLSLEWSDPPAAGVSERFLAALDEELGKVNLEYLAKRESARLGPLSLNEVTPGAFDRYCAQGMVKANTFKLPHLTTEPLHEKISQEDGKTGRI